MNIIDGLKKVWGFVGVVIDLLFLYSLLTSNGILSLLSAWFGSYAGIFYDVFVLIVLISLTLLLFWLGHRYYLPMSSLIGRLLKMPAIEVRKIPSEEKEEIYKPLRRDVEKLIERVQSLGLIEDVMSSEKPLTFWKEIEGRIPSKFYSRLEDIFDKRLKEYYDWLRTTKDFIRYQIYFYVNTTHLDKLQEEYQTLGLGIFEYNLYSSLVMPIIHGDNMSLAWFKEHDVHLWKNIEKCSRSEDIRVLFEWLKVRNPCIEVLRKNQSDLIKLAENLRDELNRRIR